MSVPKRVEAPSEPKPAKCPECLHGDKSVEAMIARHEHYLSFARVRGSGEYGVAKLKQHLIEQHGEERYKFTYAHFPGMIERKLMVESWREDLKTENLKSSMEE